MKKLIVLIMALVLMTLGPALNAATYAPNMMKHMRYGIGLAEKNLFPGRFLLRVKDELGLTEAQVDKIEKMQSAHQESVIKRKADIKIMELKFQDLLKEEKVNRAKIVKMIRDIAALRTDMQIENINHLLDIKDILTKEQLDKIEELKKKMRKKRFDRRGERRSRRPVEKEKKQ